MEYVRDQLWLTRGLAPYLETLFASTEWSAWTRADSSVPESRLARFAEGGATLSTGVEFGICAEVAEAMTGQPRAAWFVADPLARPGDPVLSTVELEYHAVDDAVYYVARPGDHAPVAEAWRQASSAAGQAGLVTTNEPPKSGVDGDALRRVAERAVLIVVSAYDGDGAIFAARSLPRTK